jgi:hypothetical protein
LLAQLLKHWLFQITPFLKQAIKKIKLQKHELNKNERPRSRPEGFEGSLEPKQARLGTNKRKNKV